MRTKCDKTSPCHENQGFSEELPFAKALPLEDVGRDGWLGMFLAVTEQELEGIQDWKLSSESHLWRWLGGQASFG